MDPNNVLRGNVPSSARDDWAAYGGVSSRSQASDGTVISEESFSPSRNVTRVETTASGRYPGAAGPWSIDRSPLPGAAEWTQTPVRGNQGCRPCPWVSRCSEDELPPEPNGAPPGATRLPEGMESGCYRLQCTAGAGMDLVPCPGAPACLGDLDAANATANAKANGNGNGNANANANKEASRHQFNAAFSVVVSTAMMLAYKDFPVPDAHRKWTKDFLSLIKDDEGQVPPNIAGILWELDSTDPSTRARQASARR